MYHHSKIAKICEETYQDSHTHMRLDVPAHDIEVAGIVDEEQVIHLFFRGTEALVNGGLFKNFHDMKANLLFMPYPTSIGNVHLGYYHHAVSWLNLYEQSLEQYEGIHIYGHSYGAGLGAQVAWKTNLKVLKVILFGEPNGFSEEAQKNYEMILGKVTTSYRLRIDPITFIPFGPKSCISKRTKIGESKGIISWLRTLGICDHIIERYVESLRQGNL